MRVILIVSFLFACAGSGVARENSALNLNVPSHLDAKSLAIEIRHRFYGVLTEDPFENFFGLNLGANAHLGMRYALIPRLEINVSYTTYEREYRAGASYATQLPAIPVQGQLDFQYFDFSRAQERFRDFYAAIALQSEPIARAFIPTVNVGYDGYSEKVGFGFCLEAGFEWEFGPIERISLAGEYYPVLGRDETINGPNNYYAAGLRIDTYGHQFMLQISNGWEIGPRRLMLGAITNDVYLGLSIHRYIRF